MFLALLGGMVVGLALLIVAITQSERLQSYLVYLHWLNPLPACLLSMDRLMPAHCDNLTLTTPDRLTLGAWLVRSPHAACASQLDRVVLYFHGNAGSRRHFRRQRSYQRLLAIFGADALFTIDYRGFADSHGRPSEAGLITDALAAYHHVVDVLKARDVFVWGHSLGSGVATALVAELKTRSAAAAPLRALFLEAPFRSIPDAAAGHYVGAPLRLLPRSWRDHVTAALRHRFSTEQRIRSGLPCPVMLLHARNDGIISVEHTQILVQCAQAAGTPHAVLYLDNEGHNGVSLSPTIDQPVRDFINQLPSRT